MSKSAADVIRAYNAQREPERLAMKMAAMRQTAFGFMRGSVHLFWQRVAEAGMPTTAPGAWCCADLHLQNFGTYRGDNGQVYFDLNDFDEAALAPCDWEIVRLLTSLLVAAPSYGITKGDAKELAKVTAEAYRAELAGGKVRWIERKTAMGAIGALMGNLRKRDQGKFLNRRTYIKKGVRKFDLKFPHILAITDAERGKLKKFVKALGKARGDETTFGFLDAARRIAGTGSLGNARYVLLLDGGGSPDHNVILDLKAAQPSTIAAHTGLPQPAWPDDATRIVEVQYRCEAVPPAHLSAVSYDGKPFVLKELQPDADRLDLAEIAQDRAALTLALQTMAQLTAWAQLRSSGRDGSATADQLMAFAAADKGCAARLVAMARDLAATVQADYTSFCDALDAEIKAVAPKAAPGTKKV